MSNRCMGTHRRGGRPGLVVVASVMLVRCVCGVGGVAVMAVVVLVDRRPSDVVPDEQQHRLEEVYQPALRRRA